MKTDALMNSELIAPCGINCSLCLAYQRDKNKCPGCRYIVDLNLKTRINCIIKNCAELAESDSEYCGSCNSYPCKRLKSLEKRYSTKYGVSLVDNLLIINNSGVEFLIKKDKKKWLCDNCGSILSMHKNKCNNCGNINPYFGK